MESRPRIPVTCCMCGREKTPRGWQYIVRPDEGRALCSHGLCEGCFEAEVMKISLRARLPLAALGRRAGL